jgi:hypothetical protein
MAVSPSRETPLHGTWQEQRGADGSYLLLFKPKLATPVGLIALAVFGGGYAYAIWLVSQSLSSAKGGGGPPLGAIFVLVAVFGFFAYQLGVMLVNRDSVRLGPAGLSRASSPIPTLRNVRLPLDAVASFAAELVEERRGRRHVRYWTVVTNREVRPQPLRIPLPDEASAAALANRLSQILAELTRR